MTPPYCGTIPTHGAPRGPTAAAPAVPLSDGLADWLTVRDRLKGVPIVRRSDVVTIGRQAARVEIHYLGDAARLRLALAQRDLVLDGGEDNWTLRPRGGVAQPAI